MMRSIAKTTFFAMALAFPLCEPASADFMEALKVSPRNSTFGPGAPVFEVESDGESWTSIKPGKHLLEVSIDIASGSGWRITNAYIGVPSADFGGTSSQSDATIRLGGGEDTKRLNFVTVYEFHTDALGFDRQAIVDACNAGDHPPTQEHPASSEINVGIKAFFMTRKDAKIEEGGDDQGRSQTAYARAPVSIRCLAAPSHAETPPKPVSVDIRVAQKGNTCPKDAEVTAYIDYEKPMTGRFQVVHNGKPGETIEIKAREVSLASKTWYRIERLERYELDPGKHDFQIKVIGGGESPKRSLDVDCPPFQATSMWLTLNTENKSTCPKSVDASVRINGNGPGSVLTKIKNQAGVVMAIESIKVEREGDQYVGRLTKTFNMSAIDTTLIAEDANDPSHNSGWQPLKIECLEVLSGKLTLQSLGATSCKGEALVAIHTDGAGELPYELECGPGKSWQRKVAAMANKIGVDKVTFDVTNNEQVTCALRTRIGGKLKPLDGASMTFTCHKPIDTGADDLAPETRPDPQRPDRPGKPDKIVIDPPRDTNEPKIACAGGTVKDGACVCERTMKPVKAGKNAWRCVKVAVDPKPDKPTVTQPKISCAGGSVRNGACACDRGEKPVKAGKNAWRCVKIAVIDPPRNKDSGNRSDAKPKNNKSVKIGKAKADFSRRSSSSMPR